MLYTYGNLSQHGVFPCHLGMQLWDTLKSNHNTEYCTYLPSG